jgi:signal peptidase I
MVPVIMPGAFVVASPYPYEQLIEGDIVVFEVKHFGLVIHRLHKKVVGGWTTKGDNNNIVDYDAMTEWNYKGKVTIFINP